jgi:hypothetical protein
VLCVYRRSTTSAHLSEGLEHNYLMGELTQRLPRSLRATRGRRVSYTDNIHDGRTIVDVQR